ncbi:MAG TPA: DUF4382 domain-containing protein [Nitrososphaerales archaeon]|nr:DUF4382 domain-containing protein [Nitrososphaerales archaeon]
MEPRTKALFSGCLALVLALVIILSATTFGFAPVGAGSLKPSSSGSLAIMLTDPPSFPQGVTAVYISYDALQIHAVGFTSSSGWVGLDSRGTIEALSLANLTETITSSNVPSGTYDSVAFGITGCRVDYQGRNYTATVDDTALRVPFVNQLVVAPSGTSTALVDLHSTILNLGSRASPQFLAHAAAQAVEVPPAEVQSQSVNVGSRSTLKATNWYTNFTQDYGDRLTIGSVSLTPHSLSLAMDNPTHDSIAIRMIVIMPAQTAVPQNVLGSALSDATVLIVQRNGSLQLLQAGRSGSLASTIQSVFESSAFLLASGASATFTYAGNLNLPAGASVVGGGLYSVTAIGNQLLVGTVTSSG